MEAIIQHKPIRKHGAYFLCVATLVLSWYALNAIKFHKVLTDHSGGIINGKLPDPGSSKSAILVAIHNFDRKRKSPILHKKKLKNIAQTSVSIADHALPELDPGMVNVSWNSSGYLLKDVQRPIVTAIKFDETKLPSGYVPGDIHTYWYNPVRKHWIELKRDSLDETNRILYSTTTTDGDYINAIVKVPESPETQGYTPTIMSDMKVGDPIVNVKMIAAPTANNQGSANISYPIEIPIGRRNLQPDLKLVYNSNGGNGCLGEGWTLPVSTITVDTRWGMPTYDQTMETETYLLDGQMLAYKENGETPNRHLDITRASVTHNNATFFQPRKELNFLSIKRIGNSAGNYNWLVTDQKGTQYYYGQANDPNGKLADPANQFIAEWHLTKVRDVFGNYISYKYTSVTENNYSYLYLSEIDYTLYERNATLTYNQVQFTYSDTIHRDGQALSAKYGFLTNFTAKHLLAIKVIRMLDDQAIPNRIENIRSYKFDYKYGAFDRTLLADIKQYGDDGTFFNQHIFSYYNEDRSTPLFVPASNVKVIDNQLNGGVVAPFSIANNKTTAIGGSTSNANSFSIYAGVGVGSPGSVDESVGAQYANSSSTNTGLNTLIDIDGDGRPDKVFKQNGVIYYEKNISSGTKVEFSTNKTTVGIPDEFSKVDNKTTGWGLHAYFVGSFAYDHSTVESTVNIYFSDVNGDGLMDVVNGGTVYFNTGKVVDGVLKFSLYSSDTPAPITASLPPAGINYDDSADKALVANNPLQEVVRMWEAPYNGMINISSNAQLLLPAHPTSDYKEADGVHVRLEYPGHVIDKNLDTAHPSFDLSASQVPVNKGDKIFFRLQSGQTDDANGAYDQVKWVPNMTYTQSDQMGVDTIDHHQLVQRYQFYADSDFLLSNSEPITIPAGVTDLNFTGSFNKSVTTDTAMVQIIQLEKDINNPYTDDHGNQFKDDRGQPIYRYKYKNTLFQRLLKPEDVLDHLDIPAHLTVQDHDAKVQCIISSNVNTNIAAVAWDPVLAYDQPFKKAVFAGNVYQPVDTTIHQIVPVVPHYVFNDKVTFFGKYDTLATSQQYKIFPQLTLNAPDFNASFYLAVKTPRGVIAKTRIDYSSGKLVNMQALKVDLKKGQPFIVTIEAPTTILGKVRDKTFRDICAKIVGAEYELPPITTNARLLRAEIPNPSTMGFTFTAPQAGNYKTMANLSVQNNLSSGRIEIEVWINNQLVNLAGQEHFITFDHNTFQYPLNPLTINLKKGDLVSVQLLTNDVNLSNNTSVTATFNTAQSFPAELILNRANESFGPMYQNWGQFIYNGMGNHSTTAIDVNNLVIQNSTISQNDVDAFHAQINTAATNNNALNIDPKLEGIAGKNAIFSSMVPYAALSRRCWLGGKDSIYLMPANASTARLGLDNVKSVNPFQAQTLALPANATYGRGIPKVSVTEVKSFTTGFEVLGHNSNNSDSKQLSDFIDLNGDHFPDVIGEASIQLTNPAGTLSNLIQNPQGVHIMHGDGGGWTVAGTPGAAKTITNLFTGHGRTSFGPTATGENAAGISQTSATSIGGEGTKTTETDTVRGTWMDINGDGIADKISPVDYQMACGYKRDPTQNNKIIAISYLPYSLKLENPNGSQSLSLSPGVSAGYSSDKNSFSGGAGLTFSGELTTNFLQDMNGDGLPDKVQINPGNGNISVSLNNGNSFEDPQPWGNSVIKGGATFGSLGEAMSLPISFLPGSVGTDWLNIERNKFNSSDGVSFGGSATFGFSIWFIKVVFNPAFNHSNGISRTIRQIIDVNGDGYPDYVYSTSEGNMEVMLSNIGESNKLKTVTNPIGGTFTIDYAHIDNSTLHPGGAWVMNGLSIDDKIPDDRDVPDQKFDSKKAFTYDGGRYDRFERDFLGFQQVTTTDMDFSNHPYRNLVATYDVSNYYTAGQLLSHKIQDSSSPAKTFTITQNHYHQVPVRSLPYNFNGSTTETGIIFSPMDYTINSTLEGKTDTIWLNKTSYEYDNNHGYVTKYSYKEQPAGPNDNTYSYQTIISYNDDDPADNIFGLPTDVTTKDDSGKILKHTSATYYKWVGDVLPSPGNYRKLIHTSTTYLNDTLPAVTTFEYDGNYGVVTRKTLPNGLKFKYAYDGEAQAGTSYSNSYTYITGVYNEVYKWGNATKYDYRYGVPVWTKDLNDQYVNYALDHFGRVKKVTGPIECHNIDDAACQANYTLKINYSLDGVSNYLPNSTITHYDYAHEDHGIQTINFIDGFGRSIQVKKTAVVTNSDGTDDSKTNWIVSGRQIYDAVGRVIKSYYPVRDSTDGSHFLARVNNINPTITQYDITDRVINKILPDQPAYSTTYAAENRQVSATTITKNPGYIDQVKRLSYNGSGLLSREELKTSHGRWIATSYTYDGLHELIKVADVNGNVTKYDWDQNGHQKTITYPDAGTEKLTYNIAGQMTHRITPENDDIIYTYKYDRLLAIQYPKHPENNVAYVYGDGTIGKDFAKNQIIYQEDASGAQAFEYGRTGEITKTTRTMIVPFSSKMYTFITLYDYDSWHRMKSMTYPDGEQINYSYNRAGMLCGITGKRSANLLPQLPSVSYIAKIGYDEFEDKILIKYGNGTTNQFAFDAQRRRLNQITISGLNNMSPYFKSYTSDYSYDNLDNVITDSVTRRLDDKVSTMKHLYGYNEFNELDTASGKWKNDAEVLKYGLKMGYDDLYDVISKRLALDGSNNTQKSNLVYNDTFTFGGANKPHQISLATENIQQDANPILSEDNKQTFSYNKNGENLSQQTTDKYAHALADERKILWDEDSRINAVSMGGFVSHYFYDGDGDRSIKMSENNEGIFINGKLASRSTAPTTFELYVSPYYAMRNGADTYTKHIYMGTQRIVSQVESKISFGDHPNIPDIADVVRSPLAGSPPNYMITLENRRSLLNKRFNNDYDQLLLLHKPLANNALDKPVPYRHTGVDHPFDTISNSLEPKPANNVPQLLSYYYHVNQVGSTSFITNDDAKVVQYLEYLPFGELFVEQRANYDSQFKFDGKEQDQETGLSYFGARYYDQSSYNWLGIDPKTSASSNLSPYNFCLNNPVKIVDENGEAPTLFLPLNIQNSMPEGKPSKLDASIAMQVAIFNYEKNAGNIHLHTDGYTSVIPADIMQKVTDFNPTKIKAIAMNESTLGEKSADVLQFDVKGDAKGNMRKVKNEILDGATMNPDVSLYAGIRMLAIKGFKKGVVKEEDGSLSYHWQGWTNAVQNYNGGGDPYYLSKYFHNVEDYKQWTESYLPSLNKPTTEEGYGIPNKSNIPSDGQQINTQTPP
jgi:RHS repeat-associated protein